ncbi:MAG: PD-(D/E)XK nuclease family protein [Raineya sp.]
MVSFLKKSCEYIINQFASLEKVCILVPSRRSKHSLHLEFKRANVPTMPLIYPIDDFITRTYERSDPIELLLLLQQTAYNLLSKEQGKDNLLSWLPTLLKDFSNIDQNLIDAKQIFSNLADIERLKQWDLEEIRRAQAQEKLKYYFEFWDKLYEIYTSYKQTLFAQNKAYTGMMYRHLAENTKSLLVDNQDFEHFVFLGFNAFNKSEEKIIRQLLAQNKATLLWDTDSFYMEHTGTNPAANSLKKYKKEWFATNPSAWLWQENHLLRTKKDVLTIETGNFTLQAQVAAQLIEQWDKEKPRKTVIVLPDESLLLPLLHSIDRESYNITMGLNLQNSTLFNLITVLFEMQQSRKYKKWIFRREDGQEEEKHTVFYHYAQVQKILTHPFVRKYEQLLIKDLGLDINHSFIRAATRYIVRYNKVHLKAWELKKLPDILLANEENEAHKATIAPLYEELKEPLKILFGSWNTQNIRSVSKRIQKLMEFFEKIYEKHTDDLERFYVQKFKHLFRKLRKILQKKEYDLDFRTFKNFLFQLVRDERIPFESSRDSRLQIMGFLETRTLDFEQVIILAANEGTFPQGKKIQSLIPIDVAKSFGLPTYHDYEAMQSYYFFRLLQRAKKVALVYCSSKTQTGGGSSEISRYALQIEHDLAPKNPNIRIEKLAATFENTQNKDLEDLSVHKTPEIIAAIETKLQEQLSPTAIDSFIRCSLQYYFSYIAGIREAKEVVEDIEADAMGLIIHSVLEEVFNHTNQEGFITIDILKEELKNIEKRVAETLQKNVQYVQDAMIGNNLIAKEAAIYYVREFLEQQIEELEQQDLGLQQFEILSLENKEERKKILPAEILYQYNAKTLLVRVRGIVDRVDRFGNVLRIIDYKTGSVSQSDLVIDEKKFLEITTNKEFGKARQLWLYRYLLLKNLQSNPQWETQKNNASAVEAGIYSMRAKDMKFMKLHIGREEWLQENIFFEKTEKWLLEVLQEMLDADKPFKKTEDIEVCRYCQYKNICGRG